MAAALGFFEWLLVGLFNSRPIVRDVTPVSAGIYRTLGAEKDLAGCLSTVSLILGSRSLTRNKPGGL